MNVNIANNNPSKTKQTKSIIVHGVGDDLPSVVVPQSVISKSFEIQIKDQII